MTTYNELAGGEPFDWNAFLQRHDTSSEEWYSAGRRASYWVSCACGNQCSVIPRHPGGCPEDKKLARLGDEFHDAICRMDQAEALSILKKIEKRSTKLVAEIEDAATLQPGME